jgi:hypothetical protein
MPRSRTRLAFATLLLTAGCGGGGGVDVAPPPPDTTPPGQTTAPAKSKLKTNAQSVESNTGLKPQ